MTALISHRNYYLLHRYLYYTSQHPNTLLLSCSICDPKDKAMGWVKAVLVFVVLQSVITSLPHRAAAGDLLSPFFSTYSHVSKISGLTDAFHFYSLISLPSRDEFHGFSRFVIQMRYATAAWSVGRGAVKCRRTTPLVSYASAIPGGLSSILETTSGSSPASFPIVSSINYSCSNGSSAPAASPSPHPTNVSKLDRKYRRQRLPSSSFIFLMLSTKQRKNRVAILISLNSLQKLARTPIVERALV
ncbi:hypothetical protein GW17_00049505 [Ensete ventricosum]|nr:hypothetical protein GW17_00049505 [Ensete ventricosum]